MAILTFATSLASLLDGTPALYQGYTGTTGKADSVLEGVECMGNYPITTYPLRIPTPQTNFWTSYTFLIDDTSWDNLTNFQMRSEAEGISLFRFIATTAEDLFFEYWNGSSWVRDGKIYDRTGGKARFDINVVLDSVSGVFAVWESGVKIFEWTGNTLQSGATAVDLLWFGRAGSSSGEETFWSAIFVADEDTQPITMVQHSIDADGTNHTDWTGAYTDINEIGIIDDGNFIQATTDGDTQTFDISAMPAPWNAWTVYAVGVVARAATPAGALANMRMVCSDGTNTAETANIAMDDVYKARMGILTTAPDGTAWDQTKLANAEFGVRAKT